MAGRVEGFFSSRRQTSSSRTALFANNGPCTSITWRCTIATAKVFCDSITLWKRESSGNNNTVVEVVGGVQEGTTDEIKKIDIYIEREQSHAFKAC